MATVYVPRQMYPLNVRFVEADIAYVSACAVVTSEGPDFQRESFVTRSLQDAFPEIREYRRLKILPQRFIYRFGEVLISYLGTPLPNGASRSRGFTYLFHAVMSGQCGSRDTWLRDMQILYCNLISKAEELKIFSLALPILGSGIADVDEDLAIKALVSSILNCRPYYLTDLMIVCQNRQLLNTAMGSLEYQYYCGRGRCHLRLPFLNDSQMNASPNSAKYGERNRQDQTHYSELKANPPPSQKRDKKDRHQYVHSSTNGFSDEDMKEAMALSLRDMPVQISSISNAVMNLNIGDDTVTDGGASAYSHSDKEASSVAKDKDPSSICSICLNSISVPGRLDKCGHIFCKDCIDRSFREYKPVCPNCNMVYGVITGNQPDGQMDVGYSEEHLPGYEGHGTIKITYYFPSGTQGDEHPNPGQPFKGTTRRAYLPDNREGREVLKLLRTAFDRKLIFTVGRSTTTGQDGVVTWNDIHHKTNMYGGPTRFGYPDPTYLSRVRDELAIKGVTEPAKDDGFK